MIKVKQSLNLPSIQWQLVNSQMINMDQCLFGIQDIPYLLKIQYAAICDMKTAIIIFKNYCLV